MKYLIYCFVLVFSLNTNAAFSLFESAEKFDSSKLSGRYLEEAQSEISEVRKTAKSVVKEAIEAAESDYYKKVYTAVSEEIDDLKVVTPRRGENFKECTENKLMFYKKGFWGGRTYYICERIFDEFWRTRLLEMFINLSAAEATGSLSCGGIGVATGILRIVDLEPVSHLIGHYYCGIRFDQ